MSETLQAAPAQVPSHVPPELVRDIDPWVEIMKAGADGHVRAARFHEEFPPIFYATRLAYMPGCWVPRRSEDLRRILQDPETFSSVGLTGFSQMIGETWPLIPIEVDPPEHAKYRILLNPLFTPKRMAALDGDMRKVAVDLIDGFLAKGGCDFHEEFAAQLPTLIFLRLMGWPLEEAPKFVGWTHTLVKSPDLGVVAHAAREIADYLRSRIEERRRNPSDDFTSFLLASEIDGRKLTDDELIGTCFLVFIGGLDTVASELGFQFMHLARNPEQQDQLRKDPGLIPNAVEELLRAYGIVNMRRLVTKPVEVSGAPMRPGDFVLISTEIANRDPEAYDRPNEVDFKRQDIPHMSFSFGPHRCIGSHLARRELNIAMEEWLKRVPPFRVEDISKIEMRCSGVFGVEHMRLVWDAA